MKKLLCLVLVLVLALSLCACGEPEVVTETVEVVKEVVPEKYAELIDTLEAEDFDGAAALIDAMRPEPEIVEIEITMDNFFDYFEPYEYADYDNAQRDAQGNITHLIVYKGYALKPEFTLAEGVDTAGSVQAGLEWTESLYSARSGGLEINFDTLEIKSSVRPYGVIQKSELCDFVWRDRASSSRYCTNSCLSSYSSSASDTNDYVHIVSDITVVNASGTLYLAK